MKKKIRIALSAALIMVLLATTAIFLVTNAADSSTLGEPKIIMTTSKSIGERLAFRLDISDAWVDWGDCNLVECTSTLISDELKGNTVKIYSSKDITTLGCSRLSLTSLDISNCPTLTELDCSNNQLTELDVSNNTALTYLNCLENQLTELNVSNNTALTDLQCGFNQLTELGKR